MAENRRSRQDRGEERWEYGAMDRSLIVEDMERLGGHVKEWADKCRQGDIGAWVLFGKLNLHFWEMVEALEDFADGSGSPPRHEESIELDA